MATLTYDLKRLDNITVETASSLSSTNFTVSEILLGNRDVWELQANDANYYYLTFRIPHELPPNTEVSIEADIRTLSGQVPQLKIAAYADNSYGGSDGIGAVTTEEFVDAPDETIYNYVKAKVVTRSNAKY